MSTVHVQLQTLRSRAYQLITQSWLISANPLIDLSTLYLRQHLALPHVVCKHMSFHSVQGRLHDAKLLLLSNAVFYVDRWLFQMICQHWMRDVTEGHPPCVKLQFPTTFKGLDSLNCSTLSEINELGDVGEATQICPCHKEAVLKLPHAGESFIATHFLGALEEVHE